MQRITLLLLVVANVCLAINQSPGLVFPVLDPNTGNPISESAILTFPNGKTMKAGDYYRKLNEMELRLRSMGQTLTSEQNHLGELISPSVQAEKLEIQKARIEERNRELDKRPELQFHRHTGVVSTSPEEAGVPPLTHRVLDVPPQCSKSGSQTRHWNYSNSNNLFGASVNADLNITGTCQGLTTKADADASGKIFGANFNLLNATMKGTTAENNQISGALDVKIMGMDVVNRSYKEALPNLSDTYSQNVSYGGGFHFMIGPVPLSVTYGLGGTASFSWKATITPTVALAEGRPTTGTWVFAQGGVDIAAAGANLGTNLTLLNVDLTGRGTMQITLQNNVIGFAGNTFLSYGINALSGNVYADAWIFVPRWGVPPWKKKSWRDDLFAWSGFQDNRILINENSWDPLS